MFFSRPSILFSAAVLISFLVLTGTPADLHGQDESGPEDETTSESVDYQDKSRSELQGLLRQKIETLQNIRERTFQAHQEADRKIKTATAKRNSLTDDLEQLKTKRSTKKRELQKVKQQISKLKDEKNALTEATNSLCSSTTSLRKALSTHIKHTVPYRTTERLASLDSSTSSPDPQQKPVAALRPLLDSTRNELSDGTTSELFHQRVPLSDTSSPRKKHARLIRIGQNTLVFVTEDGKQAGYYVRKNDAWNVKRASDEQKQRFQRAIDIIRGHKQPARIPLPVMIQREQP